MMKRWLKGIVLVLVLVVVTGCANTMNAIENSELDVQAKMSDTVFLNAEVLSANPTIFVRATNTSDLQQIDFGDALRSRLQSMGYTLTRDARAADYLVTANVLYMGKEKKGMDMGSVLQSGFGGGLLGSSVAGLTGSSWRGAGRAGLGVGLAAAGIDVLAGVAFKVKSYMGVVDVQVKERVAGQVTGTQTSSLKNGIGTETETVRTIQTDKQEYRTRIAVNAKQTNMDEGVASDVIADRLCQQICGLFRM